MPELFSNEIDELSTDDLRNIRGKLTLLPPCHCFEFVDVPSCELVKHFGSSPPVVPYLDRLKSVMAAQDVYGGDGSSSYYRPIEQWCTRIIGQISASQRTRPAPAGSPTNSLRSSAESSESKNHTRWNRSRLECVAQKSAARTAICSRVSG